ncbi:MAG TPA: hypothetical protein VMC42_02150 [Methanoregulaceae archaeon]|nr:hypothetical protein [Methanoregulaceae archaeon]
MPGCACHWTGEKTIIRSKLLLRSPAIARALEMAASIGEGVFATVFPDRGDDTSATHVKVCLRNVQPASG